MTPRHCYARHAVRLGACLILLTLLCLGYFLVAKQANAYSEPLIAPSTTDVTSALPCTVPDIELEPSATWGGLVTASLQVGNKIFVGMNERVALVDASSPNNIQVTRQSAPLGGTINDIAASAGVLYAATGGGGLAILDGAANYVGKITIPDAPEPFDVQQLLVSDSLSGPRLYVVVSNYELYIYDISAPFQPAYLGRYSAGILVGRIAASASSVFLQDGNNIDSQVEVVGVSAPATPTLLTTIPSISGEIAVVGDYLYALYSDTLFAYNIANASVPTLTASLATQSSSWLSMVNRGNYLYLFNRFSILTISISEPNQPQIITMPNTIGPGFANEQRPAQVSSLADTDVEIANTLLFNDEYRLFFYDVSAPATPLLIGISSPPIATNSLAYQNKRLYFNNPYQPTILDLSDPTAPQKIETLSLREIAAVAPAGRYVTFADYSGQLIVVDSEKWTVSGQHAISDGRIRQMETIGTRLYGLGESFSIFEIANPAAPAELGVLPLEQLELGMAIVGDYAYTLHNAENSPGKISVISLANPAQPTIAATVAITDNGTGKITGTISGTFVALATSKGHLLIATSNELLVASLANPLAPQVISHFLWGSHPGGSNVSAFGLDGTKGYALTVDEEALVIDLGNPAQPRHVSTFALTVDTSSSSAPGPLVEHSPLHVVAGGGELYVSNNDGSLYQLHKNPSASRSFALSQTYTTTTPLEFSPCASITIRLNQAGATGKGANMAASVGATPTITITYRQLSAQRFSPFPANLELLSPFEIEVRDDEGRVPVAVTNPVTLTLHYGAQSQGVELYAWVEGEWEPVANTTNNRQTGTLVATIPLLTPLRLVAEGAAVVGAHAFLPALPNRIPDVTITAFEATQGTQTLDNGVPLVARRATTLRIYAQTHSEYALNDFVLTLTATRPESEGGTPLDPAQITVGPRAIFPISERSSHNNSFETPLPATWTEGKVHLRATLTQQGSPKQEHNVTGSSRDKEFTFTPMPPLDLTIVPIVIKGIGPSTEQISDRIMQLFPLSEVRVTLHTPYFSENALVTQDDWGELLAEIDTLRSSEGASPSTVYYGLIDSNANDSQVGGVGYTFVRVAIGLNHGDVAAHEVGHNFGRYHAPCGNPAYVDFSFPYLNGSIGEYGYIVRSGEILAPNQYADLMSYCRPVWISDYNYTALYIDQRQNGAHAEAAGATVPVIMVRADLQDAASATLLPTYRFLGTPTSPPVSSDYSLRLLDAEQAVLAEELVALRQAHEPGVTVQNISALLPLPTPEVAPEVVNVQLLYQGNVIATRTLQNAPDNRTPAQLTQAGDTITVRWQDTTPTLVRYIVNGSAQTLGIDIDRGSFALQTSHLPGGDGKIELLLADQPLASASTSATANSAPATLHLPDKPTTLWVTGPTTVGADQPLILYGHGYDAEDGVLDGLRWYWGEQLIGSGPTLQLMADQLPGTEMAEITLVAMDSAGHVSRVTHEVILESE